MRQPFQATNAGVRVRLKVAPKARREAVLGLGEDADGGSHVRVCLTEAPEGGKANEALIDLLSEEWSVAKTAISVVAGATQRRKVVEIRGPTEELVSRLAAWVGRLPG